MEGQLKKRPFWARRQYLINEHFQLHFIAFAGVLGLMACVVFYIAVEYFFVKYHGFAIEVGLRPADPFFRVLTNMEMMLTYIFAFVSICVVVISVIGGVIFSHRVAGPMHRLRKHLESVSRGETWSDVSFRNKDYFIDVADAYNSQMHYVRQRLGIDPVSVDTGSAAPDLTSVVTTTNGTVTPETPVDVNTPSSDLAEERKKAS